MKGGYNKPIFPLAFWIIFFLIIFLPFQSTNARELTIDANKQFLFAKQYFLKGDYSQAIDEFNRFIYFFPKDQRTLKALFKIGLSYYKTRRYKDAIRSFTSLAQGESQNIDLAVKSYFLITNCYKDQKSFGEAIITLRNLIAITDDINVKDEAYYRLGWIYLDQSKWEKGESYFGKISPANQHKYKLLRLSEELKGINSLDSKSPNLAGLLSLIPGAGYLYCERYQDALIAFFLNFGLIVAAAEAFNNDNIALGGLITLFESGFYSANIYGSIGSAHKYNQRKKKQFIDNLKKKLKVNLYTKAKGEGILISFGYAF